MNPGDRPRRTLLTLIGAVAATAAVTGLVVVIDSDPAAAGELQRFASCEAIVDWGAQDIPDGDGGADLDAGAGEGSTGTGGADAGGAADATSGASTAAPQSAASRSAEESAGGSLALTGGAADDGTNVAVEGVDELDVVDRLDAEHVLVTAAGRLSIVSLVDDEVVANLPVDSSVEATYDAERSIAWIVGTDDETGRLVVRRVAVTPTSLSEEASWSTDGWLVDARRVGDRLHVVAADGYGDVMPADLGGGPAGDVDDAVPFASGPVPCDQVLHPVGPSDTTATLLVTLPATGTLEPEHATEVIGSGEQVHVTTDAAYLATPQYGDAGITTSIHRFDLDDLTLTGSGRVEGTLLNEFSMSDHDGHLRVAVTDGNDGFGRPMPIEGDAMSTGGVAVDVVAPPEPTGDALNEVIVLDTDGALDLVGRTPRFGHPGETLHGIRFDGDLAYAVTFLQTDPFYVVDLTEPTAPFVAGEVELPGFSSYLHPVADGLVAGFGPGDDGKIAVKLFDVTDRTAPKVVDTISLGDESAIAWDHHTFVDLGDGRFAVPASTYREIVPTDCTPQRRAQLQSEEDALNAQLQGLYGEGKELDAAGQDQAEELSRRQQAVYQEGCLYPRSQPASSVVVLEVADGHLRLVQRLGQVVQDTSASRVVRTDDGWALLAGNHWTVIDDAGDETADLELGPVDPGHGMVID